MKTLGLALVGGFVLLSGTAGTAHAQDSGPPPLSVGDTVQFSANYGDDFVGEWIGTVREVKNPRGCVFVVHSKILRGKMFSMGLRFSDDFEITKHSGAGSTTIDGATLRRHGIDCIETHPTADPRYITPEDDEQADT